MFCPRERSFACGKSKQGGTETASAATAFGVCAACAAFFRRLRRVRPWSSAPHLASFLKKKTLTKNFYLSLPSFFSSSSRTSLKDRNSATPSCCQKFHRKSAPKSCRQQQSSRRSINASRSAPAKSRSSSPRPWNSSKAMAPARTRRGPGARPPSRSPPGCRPPSPAGSPRSGPRG